MATRIPVSWIIAFVVLAIFAFFGYHIIQASSNPVKESLVMNQHTVPRFEQEYEETFEQNEQEDSRAPTVGRNPPIPNRMPYVAGQTEEDLRAPEPLQATPPSTHYNTPEAVDPLNRIVNTEAEFGSNLRHPEQMIEMRPAAGMANVVPSGLGSEYSSRGGNESIQYAPEMAQNGGEFMQGISAFDTSEAGTAYSVL